MNNWTLEQVSNWLTRAQLKIITKSLYIKELIGW